jgi:hypothetical protein
MSPAMVAAAAINGKVSDVREFINKWNQNLYRQLEKFRK